METFKNTFGAAVRASDVYRRASTLVAPLPPSRAPAALVGLGSVIEEEGSGDVASHEDGTAGGVEGLKGNDGNARLSGVPNGTAL